MGLLKKFANMIGMDGKDESRGEEQKEGRAAKKVRDRQPAEDIVPAAGSHVVKDSVHAGGEDDEDLIYEISFELNDAFKEAKSHAGEVWGLLVTE
ncbi:MAG: hypothetical protein HFI26_09100 [Lachnospiraceae bacterium]|jgi:hypothetical protein|nr:hypothetical protein [Lachnospiraceae bacterium]